jgi:hypothetical protein
MSINLNFRPTSYADLDNPVALNLNGIKGQMRREMVRDMLTAEGENRLLLRELNYEGGWPWLLEMDSSADGVEQIAN